MSWSRESSEPPPERLADLIARRAERLAPDARHTLHALAVWGDDASTRRPAAAAARRESICRRRSRLLERARLASSRTRAVRIAHPLVRRVVFSSIPAGRKRELFARADELRPDAPLEVRAKQAMHGGSALEALSLLDMLSLRRAAQGDTVRRRQRAAARARRRPARAPPRRSRRPRRGDARLRAQARGGARRERAVERRRGGPARGARQRGRRRASTGRACWPSSPTSRTRAATRARRGATSTRRCAWRASPTTARSCRCSSSWRRPSPSPEKNFAAGPRASRRRVNRHEARQRKVDQFASMTSTRRSRFQPDSSVPDASMEPRDVDCAFALSIPRVAR